MVYRHVFHLLFTFFSVGHSLHPTLSIVETGDTFLSVSIEFEACAKGPKHLGLLVSNWTLEACPRFIDNGEEIQNSKCLGITKIVPCWKHLWKNIFSNTLFVLEPLRLNRKQSLMIIQFDKLGKHAQLRAY